MDLNFSPGSDSDSIVNEMKKAARVTLTHTL